MAVASASLWMEWGQDFVPTPQGGLLLAYGADNVRQAIIREVMTVGALTLDDGTTLPPELISFPTFGQALRLVIGKNLTPNILASIEQTLTYVVLKNPNTNSAVQPVVTTVQQGDATYISVQYTLNSGVTNLVTFQVTPEA